MEVPKPKEIIPLDFNEEQKYQYEMYLRSAKLLFPEAEDWTLKLATECFVRNGCKDKAEIPKDEIQKFRQQYENTEVLYDTIISDEDKLKIEEEFLKNNPDNKIEFLGVQNNISIEI